MRDGTVGGGGHGAGSDSGDLGWDRREPYRDDARAYAPPDPGIPGPRTGPPGSHRARATGGGGAGKPGGPGPAGAGGHRRGSRRAAGGRRRKAVKWVAIGAAVTVLGTAGGAYGYYEYLSGKIRKGERSSGTTNVAKPQTNADGDAPMNILILGSDSRDSADDAKLGGASDTQGARADVIMVAHLSADRSNMSVVSIPRDTRVDIPRCTDPKTDRVYAPTNDIINASLGRGGPGCTLATVQNLTGLYIDHWLMIDFAGVVKMADVVGGVQVCVLHSVWDRPTAYIKHGGSGLKLTAGTHTIKGQQALQWLRTRDAFGSDAGRAKAQHMYMSSLIRNLRSQNLFTDPTKLNHIATTAMSAFEVSEEIGTPKKLYDLGMQLKTIPPNRITMLTMPHVEDPLAPQAHYLPSPDAASVWSLMRSDVAMDANGRAKAAASPSAAPTGPAARPSAAIPVTVVNGTAGTADQAAVPHRAGGVAQALRTAGFAQAAASQQAQPSPGTTLTYPQDSGAQGRSDATAVAKALKIPAGDVKASATATAVTLTIGADWKSGTDFSTTLPKAGAVPTSADAINGADKGCMEVEPIYRWQG